MWNEYWNGIVFFFLKFDKMPKVFKNDTLRYKKGYNFKTNKKLRIWTWKNGVNIVKYNVNLRKLSSWFCELRKGMELWKIIKIKNLKDG